MAERTLHFPRFPSLHGPQRDTAGRLWNIDKIEAPYCWAAPYESIAEAKPYRIEVPRHSPVPALRMAGAL